MNRIVHPIEPFIRPDSRVLILGSFPSVKTRESGFYYGNPQNRFWKVLAGLLGGEEPKDIPAKKELLAQHGIALWDMVQSCVIKGSADSSISGLACNDISKLLHGYSIKAVLLNGQTAGKLYMRHAASRLGMPAFILPSTSPANAAFGMDSLLANWRVLLEYAKAIPQEDGFGQ